MESTLEIADETVSSLKLLKMCELLDYCWLREKLFFFPKECIALNVSCARGTITLQ